REQSGSQVDQRASYPRDLGVGGEKPQVGMVQKMKSPQLRHRIKQRPMKAVVEIVRNNVAERNLRPLCMDSPGGSYAYLVVNVLLPQRHLSAGRLQLRRPVATRGVRPLPTVGQTRQVGNPAPREDA
ncbi:MAG: hypothetical protein ACP5J3_14265, partial [Pyrobaculum sp.]